jgi:hypothetical protein
MMFGLKKPVPVVELLDSYDNDMLLAIRDCVRISEAKCPGENYPSNKVEPLLRNIDFVLSQRTIILLGPDPEYLTSP